jgi:hypothetical protein
LHDSFQGWRFDVRSMWSPPFADIFSRSGFCKGIMKHHQGEGSKNSPRMVLEQHEVIRLGSQALQPEKKNGNQFMQTIVLPCLGARLWPNVIDVDYFFFSLLPAPGSRSSRAGSVGKLGNHGRDHKNEIPKGWRWIASATQNRPYRPSNPSLVRTRLAIHCKVSALVPPIQRSSGPSEAGRVCSWLKSSPDKTRPPSRYRRHRGRRQAKAPTWTPQPLGSGFTPEKAK